MLIFTWNANGVASRPWDAIARASSPLITHLRQLISIRRSVQGPPYVVETCGISTEYELCSICTRCCQPSFTLSPGVSSWALNVVGPSSRPRTIIVPLITSPSTSESFLRRWIQNRGQLITAAPDLGSSTWTCPHTVQYKHIDTAKGIPSAETSSRRSTRPHVTFCANPGGSSPGPAVVRAPCSSASAAEGEL